jgi:plasmid maintenance system antidote protein VapI
MIARRLSNLWSVKKRNLDLTQEAMAEKIGVTQSAFSQMLHCRMVIPTETLLKISLIFQESPIKLDPSFYKRFDINSNQRMKAFLALEISRLSREEQTDLMTIVGKQDDRTRKTPKEQGRR